MLISTVLIQSGKTLGQGTTMSSAAFRGQAPGSSRLVRATGQRPVTSPHPPAGEARSPMRRAQRATHSSFERTYSTPPKSHREGFGTVASGLASSSVVMRLSPSDGCSCRAGWGSRTFHANWCASGGKAVAPQAFAIQCSLPRAGSRNYLISLPVLTSTVSICAKSTTTQITQPAATFFRRPLIGKAASCSTCGGVLLRFVGSLERSQRNDDSS